MAETKEKLPTVREHADAMIDRLISERPPTVDLDSARQAAAVPTFSAGTAALDADGKPIVPKGHAKLPEFTEGQVSIPEGTETQGKTQQELLAEHQAKVLPAVESAPAVAAALPAESKAGQEAGTQAAEALAEEIADRFAEYDEFEYDDPDLDVKIPIRVPKQYSETAKRGYGRRAALDRAIRFAKDADPTLRPLIEDGRLARLLPLINDALADPEGFGDYVFKGWQRKQNGLPLIEQAKLEAAATVAAPAETFEDVDDPFFAERIAPIRRELAEVKGWREAQERQSQEAQQRQSEQARINNARERQYREAHQDLAAAFPHLFRTDLGPNDPNFRRAMEQARDAKYVERGYDVKASLFFGGQLVSQIESERLAATGSPTADALRDAEAKHGELARREARAAAQVVGKGATMQAAPKPPPQRPNTKNADGSMKHPAVYRDEMIQYMAAGGA